MIRRRSSAFTGGLACAVLAATLPATAGAAWTAPQDLGPAGFSDDITSIASNGRGDTVTAFSPSGGIYVARAAPGAGFGAAVKVSEDGVNPRVAVDPRGVALITFEYEDGSYEAYEDRGVQTCCTGTKVVVWRPGRAPSSPRAVRRVGLNAIAAQVAAVTGRRGVVVETFNRQRTTSSAQFVPVRLDGRLGTARTVVRSRWSAASLQFVGGRAVVGLIDGRGPTRLAIRSQRPNGSFGTIRPYRSVPERIIPGWSRTFGEALVAADGRGGHVAVLQRGKRPRQYLEVVRKPRSGRLRRTLLQPGRADDYAFSMPSVAPDGWVALAFSRLPAITRLDGFGYVAAIRPNGRAIVTRLTGHGQVHDPVATVTTGGRGAAGFAEALIGPGHYLGRARWLALAGGRPRPADLLERTTFNATVGQAVMTSNRRDRARIVFKQAGRVLASRLE